MDDNTMDLNTENTAMKKPLHPVRKAILCPICAIIALVALITAGYATYYFKPFLLLVSQFPGYKPLYQFVLQLYECFAFFSVVPWYGIFFNYIFNCIWEKMGCCIHVFCIIALILFSPYLFVLGIIGAERAEATLSSFDSQEISHTSSSTVPETVQLQQKNAWRISVRTSAAEVLMGGKNSKIHAAIDFSKENYSGASLFFHHFWRNPSTVLCCLIRRYTVTFYTVNVKMEIPIFPPPSESATKSATVKVEDPFVIANDQVLYHFPYQGREVDWNSKKDIEFFGSNGTHFAFPAESEIPIEITEPGTIAWSIESSLPAARGLLQQKVNIAPKDTAYLYYPSSYFLLDDNALSDLEKEYGTKLHIDKIRFECSSSSQPDSEITNLHGDSVFIKAMTNNENASLQIRCYWDGEKQKDYYVTLVAGNSPSWNAVRSGAPDPSLTCNLYLTTKK